MELGCIKNTEIKVNFFEYIMNVVYAGRGIYWDGCTTLDYYVWYEKDGKKYKRNEEIHFSILAKKCKMWAFENGFDVVVKFGSIEVLNIKDQKIVFKVNIDDFDFLEEIYACQRVFEILNDSQILNTILPRSSKESNERLIG